MRFGSQKLAVGYALVLVLCLFPFFSASGALAVGILFSLLGWRLPSFSRYAAFMLQASIVLMGFGMQVAEVLEASQTGLRSEEHTSELQSRPHLVCRLLLEKKK